MTRLPAPRRAGLAGITVKEATRRLEELAATRQATDTCVDGRGAPPRALLMATRTPLIPAPDVLGVLDFLGIVRWLDDSPILPRLEPYRRAILTAICDRRDPITGQLTYSLALCGRATLSH